jgi:ribose transport system substrate-binding protein
VTERLPHPAPEGKNVLCVEQNLQGDIAICDGAQGAAAALGWKFRVVQSSTDPAAVQQAMAHAVQLNPDAVLQTAEPISAFPTQVQQLAAKHIPYVTVSSTDPVGPEVLADVNGAAQFQRRGKWLAEWVVAKSNGAGHAVVFDLSSYPIQVLIANAFAQTIRSQCPGCSVDLQSVQPNEIGTSLPGRIVSYLQAHPNVNYVFLGITDLLSGVPEALQGAGLAGKIHVLSNSGSLLPVKGGQIEVNVPDDVMIGWLMMDAVARHVEGVALPQAQYSNVPSRYVTKENVGSQNVPYVGVANYQELFKKLWDVG